MDSYTVGGYCGTKEHMQIAVQANSETGLKTQNGNYFTFFNVYLIILAIREPLIDLINPSGTCIGINIE